MALFASYFEVKEISRQEIKGKVYIYELAANFFWGYFDE